MLSIEQHRELTALYPSDSDHPWNDYDYSYETELDAWELFEFGCREEAHYRKQVIEQGGDPEPINPTDRRGKHGSKCRMPPKAGVRAKSGRLMKLPILAGWLMTRFGELLTAPEGILEPVFLLHRAVGLPTATDSSKRDWGAFEKVIRDLNGLESDVFVQAFEKALQIDSKSSLSLNYLCRYICDASEIELPDVHGPAINAFRLLTRLKLQDPPMKLRWVLQNSVVDIIHQHRMVKLKMVDSLTHLWKNKKDVLEKACLKSVSPIPKNPNWFSIARYKDMTAMEMYAILREGAGILNGSAGSPTSDKNWELYFSELTLFDWISWATALLIDEKATLALMAWAEDR